MVTTAGRTIAARSVDIYRESIRAGRRLAGHRSTFQPATPFRSSRELDGPAGRSTTIPSRGNPRGTGRRDFLRELQGSEWRDVAEAPGDDDGLDGRSGGVHLGIRMIKE